MPSMLIQTDFGDFRITDSPNEGRGELIRMVKERALAVFATGADVPGTMPYSDFKEEHLDRIKLHDF